MLKVKQLLLCNTSQGANELNRHIEAKTRCYRIAEDDLMKMFEFCLKKASAFVPKDPIDIKSALVQMQNFLLRKCVEK